MTVRPKPPAPIERSRPPRPRFLPAAGHRLDAQPLPLSALRARLDDGSAGADWSVDTDGVLGRLLTIPAGGTVTIPLRLVSDVSFTARAMLLPHDWRDRSGAVRACATVTNANGRRRELWSGILQTADGGKARGLRVECPIPASSVSLQLSIHFHSPPHPRPVSRAIWLEPTITDRHLGPEIDSDAVPPSAIPRSVSLPGRPGPLISVLMPVHDPPLHMLQEAIASVHEQTYTNWELCLVDDGSRDPEIIATLQRHATNYPRTHLARHEPAQGISAATNHALNLATGDYIALLDHDDTLTPDALQHVADHITADPTLDMLYSDEDIVLDGRRIWVHIKPAWSPDTLRTNGYTCHLGVYRRSLVDEIGGFRTEFNGSQDVDMILRLTERTDRIANIPRVLYHWRAHASSTAGGDAKPYAYVAARNAIAAHLDRVGLDAEVGYGPPGLYRVRHRVAPATGVDLVLALDRADGLAEAATSWVTQPHPTWRVFIAAPTALHETLTTLLTNAGITIDRITLIADEHHHDQAHALAHAADAGHSEHLLLMTSAAMGLTHDWLTRLIGYSHQPGIAAAGPIVLAPDGRIQHAGIAIPTGTPLHLLHGTRSSMDHFFGYGTSVYNVLAVSGVLATPRTTYQQLNGLHPDHHELALIDYCLRATQNHDRVVIVPDVRLRTTGPDPTTNDLPALRRLHHSWATTHHADPYYNPNYRTDRGDFEPRPT